MSYVVFASRNKMEGGSKSIIMETLGTPTHSGSPSSSAVLECSPFLGPFLSPCLSVADSLTQQLQQLLSKWTGRDLSGHEGLTSMALVGLVLGLLMVTLLRCVKSNGKVDPKFKQVCRLEGRVTGNG